MIKTTHILLATLLTGLPALTQAQVTEAPQGYKLVWSDEFDGNALDEKAWNIEVNGNGGGNQELQFYRRENVSVADGNLVLTARRENYSSRSFTSGRINSRGKAAFKHGFIQARIKMPKTANGVWPAYWMMGNDYNKVGWPQCGEMDIIEMGHANGIARGTQDRYFGGTLHYGKSASNEDHQQLSQEYTAPADNPFSSNDYHVITVEWDDTNLYMYYDLQGFTAAKKRQARFFSTNISASDEVNSPGKYFQKDFFFIFNLAVGGSFTGIYNPNAITALPNPGDEAKMYVDWVRVYQSETDANALYTFPGATNVEQEEQPALSPDSVTEAGYFGSPALDAQGKTTFDFASARDAVLIGTSGGVTDALSGSTLKNYNVDEVNNFLYIWSDTYSSLPSEGVNSFGFAEGFNHYQVNSVGWSGFGYASAAGHGKDLSMIDDSYVLHFALRGVDPDQHASHAVKVGKAAFSLGKAMVDNAPLLGDFRRDGSWTYFDVPVRVLRRLAGGKLFDGDGGPSAYVGNVFSMVSGGKQGTDLQFDNVFFYKNPAKANVWPTNDNKTTLSPYATQAVVDGKPAFDFQDAQDAILVGTSAGVTEALSASTLHDYNVDDVNRFFYIWENADYTGMPSEGTNSMGWAESWTRLMVDGTKAYAGAGYTPKNGIDLSDIDDSYYLHFALKDDNVLLHPTHTIAVGKAQFTIGPSVDGLPSLGDFRRNGEWYNFDIPVAKLRTLAGGTLFDNASLYTDNLMTFMTSHVYGNELNVDNIFFYRKKSAPEAVQLPTYTTPALDAQGKTTFDIAGARDVVLIGTSFGVTEGFNDHIKANYNVDEVTHFLYIWDGTYSSQGFEGKNSFGYDEGYTVYTVGGAGWSGLGYAGQGKGKDLSMLDDTYFLHFAMAGTGNESHLITVGNTKFAIGAAGYKDGDKIIPALADYPRDGKWYNIDIPFSEIRSRSAQLFDNPEGYVGNVFSVLSGGQQGTKLQFDNVFFYRTTTTGIQRTEVTGATATPLAVYDLSGRKVSDMKRKGIYIVRTPQGVRKVMVP